MGVYIKGMVMPTSCTNCERWGDCSEVAWFFSSDYDYEDLLESELDDRRHPNCPLVVIPEPHGRLIDADALLGKLRPRWMPEDVWKESSAYKDIANAPTIIEGSE